MSVDIGNIIEESAKALSHRQAEVTEPDGWWWENGDEFYKKAYRKDAAAILIAGLRALSAAMPGVAIQPDKWAASIEKQSKEDAEK